LQNDADAILGQYWGPGKTTKVEIYKLDGKYCGKFVWLQNNRLDTLNPDVSKRSKYLLNSTFLWNFNFDDGNYVNGRIYDPKNGKTYSCKMWLSNGDLKVRGYVGISLLGRSETFTKVK
jgi:uncharacterized protein (DUF2147 family)